MMKNKSAGLILLALIGGLLTACGDSTPTVSTIASPTAASATIVPATTPVAATTAPATTPVAATTTATTTILTTNPPSVSSGPGITSAVTTQSSVAPATNLTMTDATNITISLTAPAQRVVCMTVDCLYWMADLGLKPTAMLQSYNTFGYAPDAFGADAAKTITTIGGTLAEPSLEDIVKARPDLIIAYAGYYASLRDPLKSTAPVALINDRTYTDALTTFKAFGRLVGKGEQAESISTKFTDRLAAYKAKAPRSATVMILVEITPGKAYSVQTDKSLNCSIVVEVAKCPWQQTIGNGDAAGYGFNQYNLEEILKADPDYIFIYNYGGPQKPTDALTTNPFWQSLRAVKQGHVKDVDAKIWESFNPHGFSKMLDQLMTTIYPDVFPQPLP